MLINQQQIIKINPKLDHLPVIIKRYHKNDNLLLLYIAIFIIKSVIITFTYFPTYLLDIPQSL